MKTLRLLHTLLYMAAAAIAPLVASCEHKELCYDHPHAVQARIDVDWSLFTEETPTGMSVMLYPKDAGGQMYTALSNNTAYVDLSVHPGTYRAVAYNQSPSEFGTITFSNMDRGDEATAYAAPLTSRWYKTRADNERLVCNPEWLAVGDPLCTVSADEVARQRGARSGTRATIATIVPQCVVYTVDVTIHIRNAYNLRSARASLDGMADGFSMAQMRPTQTVATQLIEQWTLTRDADNPANGTLHATITSFGLPWQHQSVPDANHLRLSLLLVDGTTQKDYDFLVGDAFRISEGVDLTLTLNETIDTPLPDVKPEGGQSGGFDAKVDDWADGGNIDIGV